MDYFAPNNTEITNTDYQRVTNLLYKSIVRKNLWIECLDEIGEEAMRLKSAEFAIRSLCEIAE